MDKKLAKEIQDNSRLSDLSPAAQVEVLIMYIQLKLSQRDWHAIRDACVDIERLEAILEK